MPTSIKHINAVRKVLTSRPTRFKELRAQTDLKHKDFKPALLECLKQGFALEEQDDANIRVYRRP
jgi:hypothetical protein